MGHTDYIESYRKAFSKAVTQRDQIREEIEFLKNRRVLLEEAAKALEPLTYPDEYSPHEPPSSPPTEIDHPAPSARFDPLPNPPEEEPELCPVAAITQVYVRGEGESTDEIQRRIDIALGRAAAD
ncbi:MAG TPA: hypothetical protein VGF82_30150 [Terracidiphilus sp.]|jgi:hypothetical protein